MPWISIKDACEKWNVQSRTIYRWLEKNRFQSRLTDDNQRLILVEEDTPPPDPEESEPQVVGPTNLPKIRNPQGRRRAPDPVGVEDLCELNHLMFILQHYLGGQLRFRHILFNMINIETTPSYAQYPTVEEFAEFYRRFKDLYVLTCQMLDEFSLNSTKIQPIFTDLMQLETEYSRFFPEDDMKSKDDSYDSFSDPQHIYYIHRRALHVSKTLLSQLAKPSGEGPPKRNKPGHKRMPGNHF